MVSVAWEASLTYARITPRVSRKFSLSCGRKREPSAVTHVYGLGYSLVEIHEKTIDINARFWVLATPIDGALIDLVLVSQLREIRRPRRFISGLGFLPMKLRHRLMNRFVMSQQKRDILQDVGIWERKQYRSTSRLCQADGPIGKYRRYCRQFYLKLLPDGAKAGTVESDEVR